jgi:type I restriction enzyme S subunit
MADKILQETNTLYAPLFLKDWQEQSLYPLADWLNGMAFRDFEFSANGRPVIKIAEIKNGISGQTKFTKEEYEDKYLLKKGDMLFCWSGQPQTSIDVFWWNGPEGWLNQHIFKVTTKIEDKYFFFYLLKYLKPNFVQIAINKQTTGLGHVTKVDLERFIVKLPKPEEQRAIAAVLSSLDDKIELLREQNKTLEAIAQAIFKEWFVNFNFPNEEGKPYKSSGAKMIDSELGEIPEGWRVGKIKDFGEIVCGKTPSKDNQDFFGGKIPFIKIPDMHGQVFINKTEDWLTEDGANTQKNKFIPANSICVSCIATVGLVSITSEKSQTNQQINSIILKKDVYLEYLFLAIKNIKEDLLAIGTGGSTTLNINTTTFSNIDMLFPDISILDNFHKAIFPVFKKLNTNNSQIQSLSALRDTLLPKLMKGEVRVKGFED